MERNVVVRLAVLLGSFQRQLEHSIKNVPHGRAGNPEGPCRHLRLYQVGRQGLISSVSRTKDATTLTILLHFAVVFLEHFTRTRTVRRENVARNESIVLRVVRIGFHNRPLG